MGDNGSSGADSQTAEGPVEGEEGTGAVRKGDASSETFLFHEYPQEEGEGQRAASFLMWHFIGLKMLMNLSLETSLSPSVCI